MPSTNDVWLRNATAISGQEITLPSGQTCVARKIDLEELIEAGFLNQIDMFTSLVDTQVVQPAKDKLQGRQKKAPTLKQRREEQERTNAAHNDALLTKLSERPDLIKTMAAMLNKLTPKIVVEPEVRDHTELADGEDRVAGVVYTDMIDFMDKMELFTWAMGDLDALATFRNAAAGTMDAVADGGDVSRPAE